MEIEKCLFATLKCKNVNYWEPLPTNISLNNSGSNHVKKVNLVNNMSGSTSKKHQKQTFQLKRNTVEFLRKMNLFGIWQMQNVEQVHPVSISTLPAPETFNFLFKNTIYCKKSENLHAALVSQVLKTSTFPLSTKLRMIRNRLSKNK